MKNDMKIVNELQQQVVAEQYQNLMRVGRKTNSHKLEKPSVASWPTQKKVKNLK